MTKNEAVCSLFSKENIKDDELVCSVQQAWELRLDKFKGLIDFYRPNDTLAVSVTGAACDLKCAHCGGQYLKTMVPIQKAADEIDRKGSRSCLVSGGCNLFGKVDFHRYSNEIKKLKRNTKINMHVGIIEDCEVDLIAELADVVSIDIPVSNQVIRNVYGLELTREHYIEAYNKLRGAVKTVPHICLGLDEDSVEAEISTIDILEKLKPEILCFIIFTPTRGTGYADRKPPDICNVLRVISTARLKLPETKLILGCMRPGGVYRETLDRLVILSGVNGIVMPSKSAISMAKDFELVPVWKEECCSL